MVLRIRIIPIADDGPRIMEYEPKPFYYKRLGDAAWALPEWHFKEQK